MGYSVGIVLVLLAVVGAIIIAMIIAFYTVRRYRAKKATESDATRYEIIILCSLYLHLLK